MYNTVYPHIWMALSQEDRAHLVSVFDIKRTGVTEIRDQHLVSDGYTVEDLTAISLEKMIAYIGSEETFPRAWELTCMKVRYELSPPPIDMQKVINENKTENNAKTKKSEQK
jgi:hypothetical protein